jgi:hypothetical protein
LDRLGSRGVPEARRWLRVERAHRSALYLELLPAINSGAVELLDNGHLLRELRGMITKNSATPPGNDPGRL